MIKYTWNPDRIKNEYVDEINSIICQETGLESPKDFNRYFITYFYYAFEGEYEECKIHLGLLIDNFEIYENAKSVLERYKKSNCKTFLEFLETEYCPRNEIYGGDIITSGLYNLDI